MGDNVEDRGSREEEFAQHLLKAMQDLSKGIKELRQQNCSNNRGKGIQGEFQIGGGFDNSHYQGVHGPNAPLIPSTPSRSTIPTFIAFGVGGPQRQEEMPMGGYFVEYQSYGPDFREVITFRDFCQLKGNNRGKGKGGGSYTHGIDL